MASNNRRPPPSRTFIPFAPTPAPTPILKSSSSSASLGVAFHSHGHTMHGSTAGGNNKRRLEFSQEVAIMETTEELLEESDTDVGSHVFDDDEGEGGDASFSFDDVDSSRDEDSGSNNDIIGGGGGEKMSGMARIGSKETNKKKQELLSPMTSKDAKKKELSPMASVSRVGAKVRRLNLNDSDNYSNNNNGSGGEENSSKMDVKKSLARSSLDSSSLEEQQRMGYSPRGSCSFVRKLPHNNSSNNSGGSGAAVRQKGTRGLLDGSESPKNHAVVASAASKYGIDVNQSQSQGGLFSHNSNSKEHSTMAHNAASNNGSNEGKHGRGLFSNSRESPKNGTVDTAFHDGRYNSKSTIDESPCRIKQGKKDSISASSVSGRNANSGSCQNRLSFESPPASPFTKASGNKGGIGSSKSKMLVCPPSTARKGHAKSRLFGINDDDMDDDDDDDGFTIKCGENEGRDNEHGQEDVSPRDVVDFPFFASSPGSKNGKQVLGGKENMNGGLNRMDSIDSAKFAAPRSPPQCPPSTMKKKLNRHNMFDLNNSSTLLISERPKGLRTHGRANSFLQMFSQDSIVMDGEDGSGGLMKGSIEEEKVNRSFDEDQEAKEEEDDFIHKPSSLMRYDSIDRSLGGITNNITAPSPKRPMRNHHRSRLTPASPTNKYDTASQSGTTTTTSTSSFSRFVSDFEIVGTLGTGSFGSVYSVRNRTDKRLYAIKAAKREARGHSDRNRMLQEVYALAALSDKACIGSMHIVRYHQAWMEGWRLYIQTELCERTLLEEMRMQNQDGSAGSVMMSEKRRYKLLREMLLALDLVHKSGMIHLDIKPENIFIKDDQYKLGDFGLVSKIENHEDVEEGDSRYMSMELLSGDLEDLTKSDIFSLGETMYEICLGRSQTSLPENGQEWQDMRSGILLPMPNTPFDMQMIIREMMAPEWRTRPSAEELLKKRQLLSDEQRQLIVERNKANAANMALDAQMQRFKLMSPKNGGRKFHRSNTIC